MNEPPAWNPRPPDPETEWAVLFSILFILVSIVILVFYWYCTGKLT